MRVAFSAFDNHYGVDLRIVRTSHRELNLQLPPLDTADCLDSINEHLSLLDREFNELIKRDPSREESSENVEITQHRLRADLHVENLLPWFLEIDLRELKY